VFAERVGVGWDPSPKEGFVSFSRVRLSMTMFALVGSVLIAPAARADDGGWPVRESLVPLTDTSAERALVADKVAAAKFGTPAPIDDPAREKVVLDNVRALAVPMGVDPEVAVAIFTDQIEANKVVQRGLYALWTEHPEQAPTEKPDLVKEVRPILDRITTQLLEEIRDTQDARVHPSCHGQLTAATNHVSFDRALDSLHRTALARALLSVCR
jgi:chorismate mutase